MSGHPEDDDHTTFMRLDLADDDGSGEAPIVSRAAFQLHGFGIVNSVRDGHPGYVSDEYLNAISAETTITAAELCTAGLWRRVDGGYEVTERELVDMVVEQNRRQVEARRLCQETGGHEADEEAPGICSKCLAPLPDESPPEG